MRTESATAFVKSQSKPEAVPSRTLFVLIAACWFAVLPPAQSADIKPKMDVSKDLVVKRVTLHDGPGPLLTAPFRESCVE